MTFIFIFKRQGPLFSLQQTLKPNIYLSALQYNAKFQSCILEICFLTVICVLDTGNFNLRKLNIFFADVLTKFQLYLDASFKI